MAKKTPHKTLYVRLPIELHEALERLAGQDKRSISLETEFILDKYMRENLPEYGTQEQPKLERRQPMAVRLGEEEEVTPPEEGTDKQN